jgi:hypothetical protein
VHERADTVGQLQHQCPGGRQHLVELRAQADQAVRDGHHRPGYRLGQHRERRGDGVEQWGEALDGVRHRPEDLVSADGRDLGERGLHAIERVLEVVRR